MTKTNRIAGFISLFFIFACSSGQDTFYWYRPETGINYFAKDHNTCLYESDYWPYELPSIGIPPGPETYDLRLRSEDEDGIWAFYVALPGSQPVYVNSKVQGQWSMSASDYSECMRDKGYSDMYDPVTDYRIGVKYCTMAGCTDAKDYQSSRETRYKDARFGKTEQEQKYNNHYIGGEHYTSHYYGQDSDYYYNQEFGAE